MFFKQNFVLVTESGGIHCGFLFQMNIAFAGRIVI